MICTDWFLKEAKSMTEQGQFGKWLEAQRERRGLSQRQLAIKAGTAAATVSKIEDGRVGVSREMVRRLAIALEVPVTDAVRAWLEDDEQEGGAIRYVTDPETQIVVEAYEGASPMNREIIRSLAEQIRRLERQNSIGGTITGRDDEEERGDHTQEFADPAG